MRELTRIEEQILLVINNLGNEAYLVAIRERLHDMTGKYLDVGTIYVPLKRLFKEGMVDEIMGEPTAKRGGRAKKYYKISDKGFDMLAEIKKVQDKLWDGYLRWDI